MGYLVVLALSMVVVSSRTWSYPLGPDEIAGNADNNSLCTYKGSKYNDGDAIAVDEPCLLCRCRKGALTCSLRICTDVPNPPPAGCFVVHNANQCCPELLCETERKESGIEVRTVPGPPSNAEVCSINGSLYAEGSSLKSSDLCEYCYCIRGQQKCIKPKCYMPFEGCKPIYSRDSCCPTQYDCREMTNVSRIQERKLGCSIDGVIYNEGEMLPANASTCRTCYCMKGEVQCVPLTCETESMGECEPVYKPGQCCPTSYICSKVVMGIAENSIRSFSTGLDIPEQNEIKTENNDEELGGGTPTTASDAITQEPLLTTNLQEETLTESTTDVTDGDELKSRSDDPDSATEISSQRKNLQETTQEVTTPEAEESTVPSHPGESSVEDFAGILSRNHVGFLTGNRTVENATEPPIAEELFSSPSQADDEYDAYDYTEPRLPPSLPNLIIFPFVAADAVVKDDEVSKTTNYEESSIKRVGTEPVFYKDYFSPPTKTEGGFVPKQPPVLANSYQENPYLGKDAAYSSDVRIPSITVPPKTNSDQCVFKGQLYEHGELLSEPGDCQSCICYFGDVICQEIICPPVGKGCRRTAEKDPKSCCGKVVCDVEGGEDFPQGLDYLQTTVKTTKTPEKGPVTVADVIEVTPNPFRDVIRTEPAPDLPSLMGDLLPGYAEQQTKKPVTVTYKNLVVDYYPDFLVTTIRDDVRKKNYKNPMLYTTEIYPFTAGLPDKVKPTSNVTFPTQPTVTSSVSSSADDLEGNNSKYPYGRIESVRTSIRPVVTVATEPSRLFDFYTVEEYKATVRSRPSTSNRPRPVKKTTEVPAHLREEYYNGLSTKAAGSVKHKHSTKTKSKTQATTLKEAQTKPPVEKNAVDDSFSLDSVLRFFFNTDTTTAVPPIQSTTRKTTKKDAVKKFTANPTMEERPRQTTSAKPIGEDNHGKRRPPEHPTRKSPIGSLLKLAGCNIYGRMYRVGKIIAELSNPCLECVCTDFGVECNPLLCR